MSQITKNALANSLKQLLTTMTLDKVTVKDIVSDCGVNRQTFYYHFQDVYALLDWTFVNEFDKISEKEISNNWKEDFMQLFQYLLENNLFIINTYRSSGHEYLEQYLYKVVFRAVMAVVENEAKNMHVSEKDKKFIADFYKYALVGLVLEWIRTEMKENPMDIVRSLSKLTDGDVRRTLLKFNDNR